MRHCIAATTYIQANGIATNISLVVLQKNIEIIFDGATMESGEVIYHFSFHKITMKTTNYWNKL
jgi:hypothetical protein